MSYIFKIVFFSSRCILIKNASIMQICAQQLMAASCSAQPCGRKSIVTHASSSFASRSKRTVAPAAKPFGTASLSRRNAMHVAQAAQTGGGVGKLISKVEIPAFIPRQDLMDQLLRWAVIEVQENGMGNVGCPCKVCFFLPSRCPLKMCQCTPMHLIISAPLLVFI